MRPFEPWPADPEPLPLSSFLEPWCRFRDPFGILACTVLGFVFGIFAVFLGWLVTPETPSTQSGSTAMTAMTAMTAHLAAPTFAREVPPPPLLAPVREEQGIATEAVPPTPPTSRPRAKVVRPRRRPARSAL